MSLPEIKSDPDYTRIDPRNPWSPGLRQVPLSGTGALILALIGILLSAVILAVSDGQPLEDWDGKASFSPATYLSIASTVTNITLHYALSRGLDVSWWRKAGHANTTIGDLHRTWAYGNSFFDAIVSFRYVNVIALASILVTLAPINGPLLQRASRVRAVNVPTTSSLQVQVASQLPLNYSGYISGHGLEPSILTPAFSRVVLDYYNRAQIKTNTSCQDTCHADILGAGWAVDCQVAHAPYNMSAGRLLDDTSGYLPFVQVFDSDFAWDYNEATIIQVGAQYKSTAGCVGRLVQRNCTLIAATVKYSVEVSSDSISLASGTTIWDDTVIGPVVNASSEDYRETVYKGRTTYGGLGWALKGRFQSSLALAFTGTVGYELTSYGQLASAYANNVTGPADCDLVFSDPMDDMLAGARELMFRSAVGAGFSDSSMVQRVASTESIRRNVYQSDYLFLGIATLLSMLGIVSVTLTLNGFWRLGRRVTLSPIEVAKAFNAPILRSHDSNAPIRALLQEVGGRNVRYGAVPAMAQIDPLGRSGGTGHSIPRKPLPASLNVLNEQGNGQDLFQGPQPYYQVDSLDAGDDEPLLRLELANPKITQVPLHGMRYAG